MILTFAKLCRISGLEKPTAVKRWLKREGISFARDAAGRPWTTLSAVNRKLAKAGDDGFTLEDPEGGLSEERQVLPGRQESVDRPVQGGRGNPGLTYGLAGDTDYSHPANGGRAARLISTASRTRTGDTP